MTDREERYHYIHPDGTELVRTVGDVRAVIESIREKARAFLARRKKVNAATILRLDRRYRGAVTHEDEELGKFISVRIQREGETIVFRPCIFVGVEMIRERLVDGQWQVISRGMADAPV
jgi:hypothetical protein